MRHLTSMLSKHILRRDRDRNLAVCTRCKAETRPGVKLPAECIGGEGIRGGLSVGNASKPLERHQEIGRHAAAVRHGGAKK